MSPFNPTEPIEPSSDLSMPWSLHDFSSISFESIDGHTICVVEQVYADPDAVRSYALNTPLWSRGRGQYPGQFLFSPIPTRFYCPLLTKLLRVEVIPHSNYRFAPFAIVRGSDAIARVQSSTPHWDDFCQYVAVIYLSKNCDVSVGACAGTSFWKHTRTGLSRPPADWSTSRIKNEFTGQRAEDWLKIGYVESSYNRMVVFPSTLFHRIEFSGFEAANSIRLTQNLYLIARD